MNPVIFDLGFFTLRWYGAMAALGLLAGVAIIHLNRKYAHLNPDQVVNTALTGVIAGIVGARIFYVVQNWSYYRQSPLSIIRIDQGGLVFYGGFILAFATIIFYARKIIRVDTIRLLDIIAPALAVAHALGRIGCFFNGCCFGKPTSAPWGVIYPSGSAPFALYANTPLHPVQIYETILNLLLASLLFVLVRKCKRGVAASCYILSYGILRFVDEFFRGDHASKDIFMDLFTPAQMIGFGMIPLGLGLLIYFQFICKTTVEVQTAGKKS